jgi:hypothetical protein
MLDVVIAARTSKKSKSSDRVDVVPVVETNDESRGAQIGG